MNTLVLVADDYDHTAQALANLLSAETGCEGAFARDGKQAIDIARQRRPDVAILDIDMPRVDGIEAAQAIQALYPVDRPLLIATTNRSDTDDIAKTGLFDRIMKKPLRLDQLLPLIRDVIRRAPDAVDS